MVPEIIPKILQVSDVTDNKKTQKPVSNQKSEYCLAVN